MNPQQSLRLRDKKVSCRSIGEGPAVVLLHGFGEDHRVWREVETAFEGYRLILPDLPGSGGSERLETTTMESLAAWVRDLLDLLAIDHCVLIGHSMGGYITLAFAEGFSDRLMGWGLFHSSAFADGEEKKATRRKGIEFIRQHGSAAFLETATPNLFAPQTKSARPELIRQCISDWSDLPSDSLMAYYEAMMARPDRTAVLRTAKVPVLWILGRHDAPVPIGDGLAQVPLAPVTSVAILEGSGHMGMLEEVDATRGALLDFLALVRRPG